jgi:hypothetical protein
LKNSDLIDCCRVFLADHQQQSIKYSTKLLTMDVSGRYFGVEHTEGRLKTQLTDAQSRSSHMRSILAAAALLVAPAMMPAQALHSNVSHLVASVDAPAFAFQTSAVQAAAPRIYTGLIAPVRLSALKLAAVPTAPVASGEVVVEYTVNTAGVPQNIHVVKALDATTNDRVIAGVSQMRYKPGTLNGTAVDVPVTLHVAINN